MLSNIYKTKDAAQNEKDFQSAYDRWLVDNNKESYNKIWNCILVVCANIAKNIYKKRNVIVSDEDLEEVILDSTMYCIEFICNKKVRPEKLSSYCFLRVRCFIDNPKKVWYDQNITQMPEDNYKDGVDMEIEDNNNA